METGESHQLLRMRSYYCPHTIGFMSISAVLLVLKALLSNTAVAVIVGLVISLMHFLVEKSLNLAAIANVDPALYEAAVVDGANRWRQMWHITLPGIMPMIVTLLILRVGMMMSVGYEKTILLYNPSTYDTADVISSYVYRKGVLGMDYGFSAAVGLFNSVINFAFLFAANRLSGHDFP